MELLICSDGRELPSHHEERSSAVKLLASQVTGAPAQLILKINQERAAAIEKTRASAGAATKPTADAATKPKGKGKA